MALCNLPGGPGRDRYRNRCDYPKRGRDHNWGRAYHGNAAEDCEQTQVEGTHVSVGSAWHRQQNPTLDSEETA